MPYFLVQIIYSVVHIYSGIILIYCIFSWFPNSRGYGIIADIYKILGYIVNPYLNLFRRLIPPIGGSIDISPIVAMLVLEAAVNLILRLVPIVV